jgi:hypothetical protein
MFESNEGVAFIRFARSIGRGPDVSRGAQEPEGINGDAFMPLGNKAERVDVARLV